MEDLSREAGVTVKLSVREGVEQVTVARVEASRALSATSRVGSRFPVVLGASGACLLSVLGDAQIARHIAHADRETLWGHETADLLRERIRACRESGFCENIGSHPQGIDTLSAPLTSASHTLALTLVGLRGDFDGKRLSECRRLLRMTVAAAKPKLETLS
jgi:DNA-binding IclR family transcriptional regulator